MAPIPEAKPTPEQMAEYAALQASSSSTPISDEFDDSIPLTDELGRYWGVVSPDEAEKVEAAVKLGIKPSVVIPHMTGLKLPQTVPQSMDAPQIASTDTKPQQVVESEAGVDDAAGADAVKQTVAPEEKQEPVTVQTTTAEAKEAPPVDTTATTASVEAGPKVDLTDDKPVEAAKPKRKLDL